MIRLNRLTKSFQEGEQTRAIFKDVDLTIPKGKVAILLGRSGSGKSTLLNLISGIDLPDNGKVSINDIDISSLSEYRRTLFRRRNIGFVFQFFNLVPTLSVKENLQLPLELNGLVDSVWRRRVHMLLERVNMLDRLDSYPDLLSGGEQQRVALCRALVHKPPLLLADEVTGNLDSENGKIVLDLLFELTRLDDTTVIMATHSHDATSIGDIFYTIQDHSVITTGKSNDLATSQPA